MSASKPGARRSKATRRSKSPAARSGGTSRARAPRGGPPPKAKIRPRGTRTATKSTPSASLQRSKRKEPARRRISAANLPAHAAEVYRRLLELYPNAHCELDYRDPWELLVATILSAQCTDKRVNMVTPRLFAAYPSPAALAPARQEDVEEIIKSTGFFRSKAKSLIGVANMLVDREQSRVPDRLEVLVTLPGVGRKTANVVLGNAYGINEGVVVDTHVTRLSARLGLTAQSDAVKIELALMGLFPREHWTMLSHLLIWHGRRVCDARKPRCDSCALADICPSARLLVGGNTAPSKLPS